MPLLSQQIKKEKQQPRPKYQSKVLVNSGESFYFVYAYGMSIKEIVDRTVDLLKEFKHREPEVVRAFYRPTEGERQEVTAKIRDLTRRAINGD